MSNNTSYSTGKTRGISSFVVTTFLILFTSALAFAQVPISEGFDAAPVLPSGWDQIKITGSGSGNDFTVVTTSANPAGATPFSPTRMVQYNSHLASSGDSAVLISPPYDFSTRGGNNPWVKFRIYREASAGNCVIEVFANSSPTLAGASKIGGVYRNRTLTYAGGTGTEASNGWYEYQYIITSPALNGKINYIMFKAGAGTAVNGGGNIYIDDFTVNTWPGDMTYTSAIAVQNLIPVGLGQTDQDIIKLEIFVEGANNALSLTNLNLNTNGTTNLPDISNAKIFYTAGTNTFAAINQFGGTIPSPGTNMVFSSAGQVLVNGRNYFWLTYNITAVPAAVGRFVDADWADLTLGAVINPNIAAPAGARIIAQNYCVPTSTWGTSWPGDYIEDVYMVNTPALTGISALSNINSGYAPHPPDYTYYPPTPGKTTTIRQGDNVTIRTKCGTYGSGNNIVAWIDFNKNGIFEDYERIYEAWHAYGNAYLPGSTSATSQFKVPIMGGGTNPLYWGPTRMRVREMWINRSFRTPNNVNGYTDNASYYANHPLVGGTTVISPCNVYSYGETEDYIIYIIPACSEGQWFGWTDDWNTASNWCGGIPTCSINVVIPTTPIGGNMPTIYNGTVANCNDLTLQSDATLTVRAPKAGSLNICGDVIIPNTGKIEVINNYLNSFAIGSGLLALQSQTPYRGTHSDHRIQMIYFKNELLAKGFTAGDVIDSVGFQVTGKTSAASNPVLQGFNIKAGHTSATSTGPFVNPPGIPAAPASYEWPWITFTGGISTYSSASQSVTCPTGCPTSGFSAISRNMYKLNTPIVWDGSNNILVEVCFDQPNNFPRPSMVVFGTQTTGTPSTLFNSASAHYAPANTNYPQYLNGCNLEKLIKPVPTNIANASSLSFPPSTGISLSGDNTDYRPNLELFTYTPVSIFPMSVRGNWQNDGTFIAGRSRVTFTGTSPLQWIGGGISTYFGHMEVNKSSGEVRVGIETYVDSTLMITNGELNLNAKKLTMRWSSPTAITRTGGYIKSESSIPLSYLEWLAGNVSGSRLFPFGKNASVYVPVTLDQQPGSNMDTIRVATYATPANNQPQPPNVWHIKNAVSGLPDDANMPDRYWVIEKTGSPASASMTFSVHSSEDAFIGNSGNFKAQRWDNTTPPTVNLNGGWQPGVGSYNSGINSRIMTISAAEVDALVNPNGWQNFNAWAIAGSLPGQQLPIELLEFDAKLRGSVVYLNWTTASEQNNDYFTVEKTLTGGEFELVRKIPGAGNSNVLLRYQTTDPYPYKGLSYYRLMQTDFGGQTSFSKMVPVRYTPSVFQITQVAPGEDQLSIFFEYDSELPYSYKLSDAIGKRIAEKKNITATTGLNKIEIEGTPMKPGIYFITIYNSEKAVNYKLSR